MAFLRIALRPRFSIAVLLLMTIFIAFFAEVIRRKYREEASRRLLGAYSIGDSLDQDLLDLALGFEGRTKHIDVGRVSQNCIDLRLLRDFPQLETISFSNSSTVVFNDELVFVDIRELSYWNCSAELIRQTIPCFPNVESLLVRNTLGSGIVLDDDLDLMSIRNCKRLKRIDIVHDGITGSFLESLPELSLERLRLESNLIRHDVLHSLIRFKNLAELELQNSGKPEREIDLKDLHLLLAIADLRLEYFRFNLDDWIEYTKTLPKGRFYGWCDQGNGICHIHPTINDREGFTVH